MAASVPLQHLLRVSLAPETWFAPADASELVTLSEAVLDLQLHALGHVPVFFAPVPEAPPDEQGPQFRAHSTHASVHDSRRAGDAASGDAEGHDDGGDDDDEGDDDEGVEDGESGEDDDEGEDEGDDIEEDDDVEEEDDVDDGTAPERDGVGRGSSVRAVTSSAREVGGGTRSLSSFERRLAVDDDGGDDDDDNDDDDGIEFSSDEGSAMDFA